MVLRVVGLLGGSFVLLAACGSDPRPAPASPQNPSPAAPAATDTAAPAANAPPPGMMMPGMMGPPRPPPVCNPLPVADYRPQFQPPSAGKQGKCTVAEIDEYIDQCFEGGGTEEGCARFEKEKTSCVDCMVSDLKAPKSGPIVTWDRDSPAEGNAAGCIAAFDGGDTSPASCAAAVQAANRCERTACSYCLGEQGGGGKPYVMCTMQAGGKACAEYRSKARTCVGALAAKGLPVNRCLSHDYDLERLRYVSKVMCGPPSFDPTK